MRRILLTLSAVAVLALLAAPAKAQSSSVGVFGSYWDTKDADQGYGGGVKFDFARYLELRASYFSDVTSNNPVPGRGDFKLRVVPLEGGLVYKFQPNDRFTPYLGAGASYLLLDTNRGNIDNELGWYAVGGADIKTDHGFGVMLEAIYRSVDSTIRDRGNDTTVDTNVDLQLRGFGANVGLVWSF